MKRTLALLAILLAVVGVSSCVTAQPGEDQATATVNQMISIANAVDAATQAILATNASWLTPSVIAGINLYHTKLPDTVAALKTALAAYQAGTAKDYAGALTDLALLVAQVEAILDFAGHPGALAHARTMVL